MGDFTMMMNTISATARQIVEGLVPDFFILVTMEVRCSSLGPEPHTVMIDVQNESRVARSLLQVQPTVTVQSTYRPPVHLRRIRRRISSYPNPAPDFCFVPAVGVYQLAQPERDFWVEEPVPQLYTVVILQLSDPPYLMFLDVNVPSHPRLYHPLNLGARFQPILYQPPRGEGATVVLVISYLQHSEFRIARAPGLMSLGEDDSRATFNLNAFTQDYQLQPARLMVLYVMGRAINLMTNRIISYDRSRDQSVASQSELGFGPMA